MLEHIDSVLEHEFPDVSFTDIVILSAFAEYLNDLKCNLHNARMPAEDAYKQNELCNYPNYPISWLPH